MPLSWNDIRNNALAFAKEWAEESSEDAEAKSFWDGFFTIFGLTRKRLASFEEPVKKLGERRGFIDLFWKGELLVEHKSRGKDLDKAYDQALEYFPGIKERDLPKRVLVSDFARFRLYDLESGEQHEFGLVELHKNVHLFGFIAGYQTHKVEEQDPVNIQAAERMGLLHDQMKAVGYEGTRWNSTWCASSSAFLPTTPASSSANNFRTTSSSAPPRTAAISPTTSAPCSTSLTPRPSGG